MSAEPVEFSGTFEDPIDETQKVRSLMTAGPSSDLVMRKTSTNFLIVMSILLPRPLSRIQYR